MTGVLVLVVDNVQRRARGRPSTRSEDETRKLIIDAAIAEFAASGYVQTSMESVARRAGISTRTLYKLVPNKADLFRIAVESRIESSLRSLDVANDGSGDAEAYLEQITLSFARLSLSEEAWKTMRLAIAEIDQFPEVIASYRQVALRIADALADRIRSLCDDGLIDCPDPELAANLLRSMVVGPQRQMILGVRPAMTQEEIEAWARACTRMFLCGCGMARQ